MQPVHHQFRQVAQGCQLAGGHLFARQLVDDAQAAERMAIVGQQRHAGVIPYARIAGHQHVVPEPGVEVGIRHLEKIIDQDGMATERDIARRGRSADTDLRPEPLLLLFEY